MQKVIILTEGGNNIGFGHLTRCLSLYQAFEKRGFIPEFRVAGDDSIQGILANERYYLSDWLNNPGYWLDKMEGEKVVIVDSYLAPLAVYEQISNAVDRPIFLDDNCRLNYPAGIVINWSICAKDMDYPRKPNISYLLGPDYISLRKAFWKVPKKTIRKRVNSIFVTFGGDDSKNLTPRVVALLSENYPSVEKNVVIGSAFSCLGEIKRAADPKTNLIYSPDDKLMKSLMLESDVAVSSGGQTIYELARVGLPAVVVAVADNQRRSVDAWQETGFIKNAGFWQDPDLGEKIIAAAQALEDENDRRFASDIGRASVPRNGADQIIDFIER
jgi:spore coat polysaccharide biosynthesis predicted glycosyltransferase SpsG